MKKCYRIFVLSTIWFTLAYSQSQNDFDVDIYKRFLAANRDLTANQLYQMHPMPKMRSSVNYDLSNIAFIDSIDTHYSLTQDELEILGKNGFVVSERLSRQTFGKAFLEIFQRDLPVFVSTNAHLPQGNYLIKWDGTNQDGIDAASGIYFSRLRVGELMQVKKMSLVR